MEWSELASPSEQALLAALLEGDSSPELLGRLAKSPYLNALARTTCVATQLNAGHAENALPQSARAVINCRVVPQSSAEHAKEVIESIVSAHGVTVKQIAVARPSPASPLDASVLAPIKKVADELWPGIPLIPEMSTGATDGLFVRNAGIPVYGVSAIAEDPDDIRAHGQDERIRIDSYRDATEYWYRLTREVAGGR
jgi:acetylornithine deacetylase/succinyl-diaminopimelate desuccinylase-like protein